MFVIRFKFDSGPMYAGRIGRGTTAGGWGFTPYFEASEFDDRAEAESLLAEHYSAGPAGNVATIMTTDEAAEAEAGQP